MLGKGGQTGVNLQSTYKGTPFGTCKMTGKLVIPDTQQTWKCKGGSFKLVGHGTTGAANDAKGTWKITKGSGTGKYKGITGKGTFAASSPPAPSATRARPAGSAMSRRAPTAPGALRGPRSTKGP